MAAFCDLVVGIATLIVLGLGELLDTDQYTDLIRAKMTVQVDPLVVIGPDASTNSDFTRNCSLVLKKDSCTGPILDDDSGGVSWDTQICFQWSCSLREYSCYIWYIYYAVSARSRL